MPHPQSQYQPHNPTGPTQGNVFPPNAQGYQPVPSGPVPIITQPSGGGEQSK